MPLDPSASSGQRLHYSRDSMVQSLDALILLRRQLAWFQARDRDRHKLELVRPNWHPAASDANIFLEDLLAKLEAVTKENAELKLDLDLQVSARRQLQQEKADSSSRLASWPYVAMVIDADRYHPQRLDEGMKGGACIADELIAHVRKSMGVFVDSAEDCGIIIDVYANTSGLGQTLVARGQVRSLEELKHFWTGFVCRQPLFAYVDVGQSKEKASQKIRGDHADHRSSLEIANGLAERVLFHSGIYQCKQVFLACCHDGGYEPFLSQFVSTGKVTLVKNGVCHPKLESLGLPVVQFPGLFVEMLAADLPAVSTSEKTLRNPFAMQTRLEPVLHGNRGLRRDRPLVVNQDMLDDMENSNICAWFYLIGECKGCAKIHNEDLKLSVGEFDALWATVRRGECYKSRKRKVCQKRLCIYGHKDDVRSS